MKKYIFITLLFLLAYEAYPQVSLSTRDSVTSFQPIDLFWLQRKVTGSFVNRKVSWSYLRSNMIDYIDGLGNTWAATQTFSKGATFNAGSSAKVTILDSLIATSVYINGDPYNAGSRLGNLDKPFLVMYSKNFVIVNTAGTDSAYITLNSDGEISIPNLTVTEKMNIDSSATFDVLAFTPHSYTIPNIGDTILTIVTANRYSMLELDLPGNMTTGISRIYVQGAQKGMVLRIYNMDASYAAKIIDYNGNDDNMYLSADFDFGQYDYLELMCVVASIIGQTWIETGRANN